MTIDQEKINDALIAVGEYAHGVDQLWAALPAKQYQMLQAELKKVNNKQVVKQTIITHLMLTSFYGSDYTLTHLASGKPVLNGHLPISISHSGDYVAIIRHPEKAVGIDFELRSRNALKVVGRVCAESELAVIQGHASPNDLALLYWCAKEATYKMLSELDLCFSNEIKITSEEVHFNLEQAELGAYGSYRVGALTATVRGCSYTLHYKITSQFILCWGVQ